MLAFVIYTHFSKKKSRTYASTFTLNLLKASQWLRNKQTNLLYLQLENLLVWTSA